MRIVRRSIHSAMVRVKDLPISEKQVIEYEKGVDINICMPQLTESEKMFFVSGITEDDWEESTVSIGDKYDKY
jgi:hypothetical protein